MKNKQKKLADELAERCNIMSLDSDCPFEKCLLKSELGLGLCREKAVTGDDWIKAAKLNSKQEIDGYEIT